MNFFNDSRGAQFDIPDNTGQTQRQLAAVALDDAAFPQENARVVLEEIG